LAKELLPSEFKLKVSNYLLEYEGLNLMMEVLEELETTGMNLNVDGTFLPKEFHQKMILKEEDAAKIVEKLIKAKFMKINKNS
jgi:sulfur carrier protein ThiS